MRKARKADLKQIMSLLEDSFSNAWEKTDRRFHKKFVEKKILKAIQNDIVIVEEKNNKLIGFGWAHKTKDFFGNKIGEIILLLVLPEYQNKKIGTNLLNALEKKLGSKNVRLDCLTINKAKKLYKKQGYKEFITTLRKTR